MKHKNLEPSEISEIIEMALSDHISFGQIQSQYGLRENEVKVTDGEPPEWSFDGSSTLQAE